MSSSRTNNTSSGMFSPKPMSWSRPRESLSPQLLSSSSELSVSRPDFCTASLRRWSLSLGFIMDSGVALLPVGGEGISPVAVGQVTRHAADGGDADTGDAMYLAVGQAFLQPLHHRPSVGHGLQLGRCTEIAEEGAAFIHALECQHGSEQVALRECLLACGDVAVLL